MVLPPAVGSARSSPVGWSPCVGTCSGLSVVTLSPSWGLGSCSAGVLRASSLPGAGRTGELWDSPLGDLGSFGTCQGASGLGFSEVCCEPVPSGWPGLASPPALSECVARLRLAAASVASAASAARAWPAHEPRGFCAPTRSVPSFVCVCVLVSALRCDCGGPAVQALAAVTGWELEVLSLAFPNCFCHSVLLFEVNSCPCLHFIRRWRRVN